MSDGRPPTPGPDVAAFFDLDKTVIAKSSILAFSREFFHGGLLDTRTLMKSVFNQLTFALSPADADHVERLRRHVTTMCRGWDATQVQRIVAESLDEVVTPLIYAGAAELIALHHDQGHDVVLVSASGHDIVEPIGALLGVDHVRASEMRVDDDGHYTGELTYYCYGEEKRSAIESVAAEYGYDLDKSYAFTDSITDVPMLESVGHPRVVNPDRALRRQAENHGWPIYDFALETEPSAASAAAPALAAALVVGVGAAVGYGMGVRRTTSR
ncbi:MULTISPECIES: HAD family hydrolase [unclassified Gordonia (in: high G+C Gram-positive bacteria)]